ncbi:hypothetical protein OSB04_024158 [Centaurea solstitialis]|uniref:Integrase catalytic domain-containing protein n=1 Tax=Centaurea solstitialis TaxID=347529 RepID=A0AA38SXB2_9ASTR|nr:hypothetical protein OSB04_024158 [Centaurea solstitialis]
MRTLGCLAYYSSVETGGDKFEFRGRPGVFMGYPQGTKGFKILDIEHGKMAISRDVKFVENNFPFVHLKSKNPASGIFEVPVWHEDDYVDQTEAENVMADSTPQTEPTQSTTTHAPTDFVDFGGDMQVEDDTDVEQPHNESRAPRSTRVKLPSSRLQDYEVTLPPSVDHAKPVPDRTSSTVHPLSDYVSYNKFSASHKAFLAAITSVNEPKSFEEAMQDENWRDAMQCEIKALEDNETWTLETLPEGKHATDSKWVYKIKYKPTGETERYKARLVARGFTQIEGVDCHDTFAPVARLVTIRTLITIAVKKNWLLHQLHVNNAFLHGDLQEEVYMKMPQGFSNNEETKVCRLRKSLYGLKQASRTWYQKFTVSLLEIGYAQSNADHSLFTYRDGGKFVAILIYVDDVVITGDHVEMIQRTNDHLNTNFSIKDLGPLKYFLGIEVARMGDGMVLSQHNQFVSDPRVDHIDAVLRVLRYLKSTLGQGIFIPKSGGFNLVAYCDADWLGCPSTRRSRTGYLLLLGGALVSWKTKKQSMVSRSSVEAEYRAMATTVSEILWMRWLLKDLTIDLKNATPLYCDNQATRHIANNLVFHERTKHVEMDSKINEDSAIMWHKHLGHISKQRIQRLVDERILNWIDLTNFQVCVECIKGKQANARRLGSNRAIDVLELIYTDICGPFPTASWNGQRYFITFIDDYSRYGYLYLIHEKSQSLDVFKDFKAEVELQLGKKIKAVRSNRGGEYYGRYEGSGEQSPGKKPSINHLHVWGCPAEARAYNPHERKLDSRTISCYFVGYQECSRGFKFYNPTTKSFLRLETQDATPVQNTNEGVPLVQDNNEVPPTVEQTQQTQEVPLRRSTRERRSAIPDDYIGFLQEHETQTGIREDDPINLKEALSSSNSQKWIDAMADEMKSMKDNDVWDLVELPKDAKPIGYKWIFKSKKDSNGNIERYKARLVAKGFTQKEGIDYEETFSPVSSKDTFRTVMVLVAHYDLELQQMDVKTAFLKFHQVITSFGYQVNLVEDCVYHKFSGSSVIFLILYVDDILIATNDLALLLGTGGTNKRSG